MDLNLTIYIESLRELLARHNVCPSHGIEHALIVMSHAEKAIQAIISVYDLKPDQIKAILLAALLHDADDRKFFPSNDDYQNLRLILAVEKAETAEFVDLIIQMVKLVSASANGDNIPESISDKLWMLIPRYADRLEAIGLIGIQRCYKYNKTIGAELFLETTPRLTDPNEIIELSLKRFKTYDGSSQSMMDHFYDKLVAISVFPIRNSYFDEMCEIRRQPIMDFIIYFSKNDRIDMSKCV